ncbi:MAG: amidohydrolase family protein [Methanophagales archaeon]|nr:amidohydrolase family protein [Methanophagales archaeon]
MNELMLSGTIVYGDEFEEKEGHVVIEQGKIKEIGDEKIEAAVKGIIIPSFVNAHTHIGDSVAKEPDFMPIEKLVGPGGLKHKILAETPYDNVVSAMKATIEDIFAAGTQLFADFREGGVFGVRALKEAFGSAGGNEGINMKMKIFGRPAAGAETEDIYRLFESVDGIGMSSVADHPQDELTLLAEAAKREGKIFALHAGERNTADIKGAIELEPDFIVHLIKALPRDFRQMRDKNISAVVCIRSNLVTGVGLPPVSQMLESGLTVGVGTDNVMLTSPDIFSEMEFISKIFRLDAREVLKMCTLNSAKVLKEDQSIGTIEEGKKANLLVIRTDTPNMRHVRNPIRGVVRRATRNDLAAIIYEGEVLYPRGTSSSLH